MKHLLLMLFLVGCASPLTPERECFGPPLSFQGKAMTDCFQDKFGATCCGYGYMPQGRKGPVCFHLVCQLGACTEWTFNETKCYDQEQEEENPKIEVNRDSDPGDDEGRGAYI